MADADARSKYPVLVVSDAAKRRDVSFLIEALSDVEMRGSAALRLGELRARRAVPALIRNLRVRNDLDRSAAVTALRKIGDPSSIEPLREVAGEDEAAGVRANAIIALAELGDRQWVEMLVALAVDPRPVIASCDRWVLSRHRFSPHRASYIRWQRRWAAKRLRKLLPADAATILENALPTRHPMRWLRLRWTLHVLRRRASAG